MAATIKTFVPAGSAVLVRKVGDCGPWTRHTTTKPVDVPAGYALTAKAEDVLTFEAKGYTVKVKVCDIAKLTTRTRAERGDECPRCGGRGHIACYQHVQGGVCFKCGGSGSPKVPPTV